MTDSLDYSRYGLDPATALPAVTEQHYIDLTVKLVQAQVDLAQADDDPEDREILTERVDLAQAAVDSVRREIKMTKAEGRERQRNILANNIRSLAQEHLTLEATKTGADESAIAEKTARQVRIVEHIGILEKLLAELD